MLLVHFLLVWRGFDHVHVYTTAALLQLYEHHNQNNCWFGSNEFYLKTENPHQMTSEEAI